MELVEKDRWPESIAWLLILSHGSEDFQVPGLEIGQGQGDFPLARYPTLSLARMFEETKSIASSSYSN